MRTRSFLAAVLVIAVTNVASADTIRGINMDFVTIGNARNPNDSTGFGAVNYAYRMGKYEVTAQQYNTAAAAGGFHVGSGSGNTPIAESWIDAAYFCNYLTTGNKDIGVYHITGVTADSIQIMDHQLARSTYGVAYFMPSQDEWYKAAYYKPDKSGYSLFANGTSVAPIAGVETNYNLNPRHPLYWDVGSGAMEQNGTFDMMGNRFEWTEGLDIESRRIICGGASGLSAEYLMFSGRLATSPENYGAIGFRIASTGIPEPASLLLLGLGARLCLTAPPRRAAMLRKKARN